MRRPFAIGATALVLFLSIQSNEASAQFGGGVGSDPFSFYYGYYLPHQAYVAAQPRALDSINQAVASRQYSAQTDRSALYDPISPYGDEESDPLRPYSDKGRERRANSQSLGLAGGGNSSNATGSGPSMYYSRTARYFPALRTGRGPNRNVAAVRGGRGGGGGMPSFPGGGGGFPGQR